MAAGSLDRLLTTLAIRLHASSVCVIQNGTGLAFSPFDAITVHFVLSGQGALRVGSGGPLAFASQCALVVPANQPHVLVGGRASERQVVQAAGHCGMVGDGLVSFTAGDGSRDTLMLCGMIGASDASALGLFDLPRGQIIHDFSGQPSMFPVFDQMLLEITTPGFGTQAMAELLMKQCFIALLRHYFLRDGASAPIPANLHNTRLARAVFAILDQPASPHSVGSLADLAGMSRASFAEHFSRTFEVGPIEFVQKVRLKIAARLLKTTDLPLKVIARSVGYASHPSFARAFRQHFNMEPTSYRRRELDDTIAEQ